MRCTILRPPSRLPRPFVSATIPPPAGGQGSAGVRPERQPVAIRQRTGLKNFARSALIPPHCWRHQSVKLRGLGQSPMQQYPTSSKNSGVSATFSATTAWTTALTSSSSPASHSSRWPMNAAICPDPRPGRGIDAKAPAIIRRGLSNRSLHFRIGHLLTRPPGRFYLLPPAVRCPAVTGSPCALPWCSWRLLIHSTEPLGAMSIVICSVPMVCVTW
jgi:hypothetical protein